MKATLKKVTAALGVALIATILAATTKTGGESLPAGLLSTRDER